jgi:hypothetical protein
LIPETIFSTLAQWHRNQNCKTSISAYCGDGTGRLKAEILMQT